MPEGPEVRVTCDALGKHYTGKQLVAISWNPESRHFSENAGSYQRLGSLLPRHLSQIFTHGKRIIFELLPVTRPEGETASGLPSELKQPIVRYATAFSGPIYLVSFLAMSGSWRLIPNSNLKITLSFGSFTGVINVVEKEAYCVDAMGTGRFDVAFNLDELQGILRNIGPDLLEYSLSGRGNADFTQWCAALRLPKLQEMRIGDFFLEQDYFSGVGNYLRAEILYRGRINPFRPLRALADAEIYTLWQITLTILKESYLLGGHTIKDFFSLDGTPGRFPTVVYGQKTDPLGNPVIKQVMKNNRTMHWVPMLQC